MTIQNLQESTAKYKVDADKKQRALEFNEGDFVWVVLTKDRFPVAEHNKLVARKIGQWRFLRRLV
jgi:hypothetical protein